MGKKKSVVLLTLITIVIVVFCFVSAFPAFPLSVFDKESVKSWSPAVNQYDLDADLSGGYVTHYYPEGVISSFEYDTVREEKKSSGDVDDLQEYEESYTAYKGLYLSTDEELGIVKGDTEGNYTVTKAFKESFDDTVKLVVSRYEESGLSAYRVSIVDDYAIKVEIPKSETQAITMVTYFSYLGTFNVTIDDEDAFPLKDDGKIRDYFESFTAKTSGDSAYIEIRTTDKGSSKMKSFIDSGSTVSFNVGEFSLLAPDASYIAEQADGLWAIGMTDVRISELICIALESAIDAGDTGLTFNKIDNTSYGEYKAVYGDNANTMLYIAVFIAFLAIVILPIVKMGGYGVAMAYSSFTYFGVVLFCLAFITEGVFEVSAGTAILFLLGILVSALLSTKAYGAIKREVEHGKTIGASVKAGFNKSLMTAIDLLAVLVIGSLALLIAAAGLHVFAIQALICFVVSAFCSLLWTRVINYLLLSASKDPYKYFRFVREDEEDE